MKNYVKILFPALLCMTLCQTNVQGQIFKNALNKVKGALGSSAKKGVTDKAGVTKVEKSPSTGPAKPLAPDVKNPVSEMRSFTGLTKEELAAKMKSKGFVEGKNEMGQEVFKSKAGGYSLSVTYGTRGKASLVREVSKSDYHVKGGDAKIKASFLGFGRQCTDLKTTYSSGYLVGPGAFGKKLNSNNPEQRTSKFLPAFDTFITNKEQGNAVEAYSETDYEYNINYFYEKGIDPVMIIFVIDNTVQSLEG